MILRLLFMIALQTPLLQQQQLDILQARLDGQIDTLMRAYLDGSVLQYDRVFVVWGWALTCGEPIARMVIFVDGLPLEHVNAVRWPRQDVADFYATLCNVELESGLLFYVTLRGQAPGVHRVQIRLYDVGGRMAKSNELTIGGE